MLMGEQHLKLWSSSDGVRVAHLLPFDEQDVIANTTDAWAWDSRQMAADHLSLAELPASSRDAAPVSPTSLGDLPAFARRLLAGVGPYAAVSVDGTARVAGRPVYRLTLTPRSSLSRIGRIVVAVDAETRLPLRIQIVARDAAEPAIEAGFTKVSFDAIARSTFTFTPPAGATVRQIDPEKLRATARADSGGAPVSDGFAPAPGSDTSSITSLRTFGDGFDLRWAVRLTGPMPSPAATVLPYSGPLGSAMTVEREGATWLLIGFVDLATLERDADRLP